MSWAATVLTLLPDVFPGPLDASLAGRARKHGIWSLEVRDIRAYGSGNRRDADDTPAGGGPGMVLRADVAAAAIDAARAHGTQHPAIYLSPRGVPFTQARARALASGPGVLLLCGRFEGIDQRAIDTRGLEEISIGDFVLAGGELPAMVLIEACVRLLPGVMGDSASPDRESFEDGLLEYPQYTRPRSFEGHEIPNALLSGHHAEIAGWRKAQAERLTRLRRPDLWALYEKRKG